MLEATIVTTDDELLQIRGLNQENLKLHLDKEVQRKEGFVTWQYPFELLKMIHQLSPGVVIKEKEIVIAYALTTLQEAKAFHPDLGMMFCNLKDVQYKGKPLSMHDFYCMGQICVAKEYRGKGLVNMLYQKHKEIYSNHYDFILTEISISNQRSMKAHENIGFQSIYTYTDDRDKWNVVIWDWT